MRTAASLRVAAAGTVVAGVLASCSAVGDLLARNEDAGPRTARIVVLAPQDGAGAGVLAAVQLAIDDQALAIPGWTVEVTAADEAATTGETLADDDDVVAVVGGLSGQAVRAVQPALARASILFVSPADVATENTRGSDPTAPLRPYTSYFRTAVPHTGAVETAAYYAVRGLGAQAVAVLYDGGGSAEAARFAAQVRRLGSKVVATAPAGGEGAGIGTTVAAADLARVQVVYVAADAAVAAAVAKQLARTGSDARLVGGSALRSAEFVTAAGTEAQGAVAVLPATLPPSRGARPAKLAARLTHHRIAAPGPFAAAAYDAGTAVAEALTRCSPGETAVVDARGVCVAEMQHVSFVGVTGEVSFDGYGDRAGSQPQVLELHDGEWVEMGAD